MELEDRDRIFRELDDGRYGQYVYESLKGIPWFNRMRVMVSRGECRFFYRASHVEKPYWKHGFDKLVITDGLSAVNVVSKKGIGGRHVVSVSLFGFVLDNMASFDFIPLPNIFNGIGSMLFDNVFYPTRDLRYSLLQAVGDMGLDGTCPFGPTNCYHIPIELIKQTWNKDNKEEKDIFVSWNNRGGDIDYAKLLTVDGDGFYTRFYVMVSDSLDRKGQHFDATFSDIYADTSLGEDEMVLRSEYMYRLPLTRFNGIELDNLNKIRRVMSKRAIKGKVIMAMPFLLRKYDNDTKLKVFDNVGF